MPTPTQFFVHTKPKLCSCRLLSSQTHENEKREITMVAAFIFPTALPKKGSQLAKPPIAGTILLAAAADWSRTRQ